MFDLKVILTVSSGSPSSVQSGGSNSASSLPIGQDSDGR